MTSNPNFRDISEVKRLSWEGQVNQHLKLGWVMLNVESVQHHAHDWSSIFVLGWSKDNGAAQHPKESEWAGFSEKDSSL